MGIYLFWVLQIFVGRDVGRRRDSTCVHLHIMYTCVRLSQDCTNGAFVGTLEGAIIPPVFNYIFLLKVC